MVLGRQLTLQVQCRDEATFNNFFTAKNQELVSQLQSAITHPQHLLIYLWGNNGVGKSHLLQACYLQAIAQQQAAIYLSLAEPQLQPAVLESLDEHTLVCLDDLQSVLADRDWQEALFHFYNRLRDQQARLVVAADVSPRQLDCSLADLQSRFTWGMVYQVQGLSDAEKCEALCMRAKQRGLVLSEDVAEFLLKRCTRDMNSLFDILQQLDHASLRDKRPLTIPFVKSVLAL